MPTATRSLRFRPQLHPLEDRTTPAFLYLSQSFQVTTDTGPPGLSTGDTVRFDAAAFPVSGLTFGTNAFTSLAAAVTAANSGDTVVVGLEGHTIETGIDITKSLTLAGAVGNTGSPRAILLPASSATHWLRVQSGVSLTIQDVDFTGLSPVRTIDAAVRFFAGSSGSVTGSQFSGLSGTAVVSDGVSVELRNLVFTNVGGGVRFVGGGLQSLADSTYTGRVLGSGEVAVQVEANSGASVVIGGNRIDKASGAAVSISMLAPASVSVIGNALTGSGTGLAVTGPSSAAVVAQYNTISGNTVGVSSNGPSVDARNVWWGTLTGPVSPNNPTSGPGISTDPPLEGGPPPVLFAPTPAEFLQRAGNTGQGGGFDTLSTTLLETFPDGRTSPVVFGAGPGAPPRVTYRLPTDTADRAGFMAYDSGFTGGVRVAVYRESKIRMTIATAPGPGGGPNVKLFSMAGTQRASFFAYDPSFTGGVYVALADVNNDGVPDIITGAGEGGAPHVKVFDGATRDVIASFYAFDPSFRGGVRVTVVNRSGGASPVIVVAAGPGGGPHVRGFTLAGQEMFSLMAYEPSFAGGVYVATGDVNGDGIPDLVTGAGEGGAPRVRVFAMPTLYPPPGDPFDPAATYPLGPVPAQDFYVFDPDDRSGTTVAVGESGRYPDGTFALPPGSTDPQGIKPGEIVAGGGRLGAARARLISQVTGNAIYDGFVFGAPLPGGVAVAGLGNPDNSFPRPTGLFGTGVIL